MSEETNQPIETIDQSEAEKLIRVFWLGFNNINMYGTSHPLARKGCQEFYDLLRQNLIKMTTLTFHVEKEGLNCEKCQMAKGIKIKRLVDRLNQLDITSITFSPEVEVTTLMTLFMTFTDAKHFPDLTSINQFFQEKKCTGVSFNRFIYLRVSADEEYIIQDQKKSAEIEDNLKLNQSQQDLLSQFLSLDPLLPFSSDQLAALDEFVKSRDFSALNQDQAKELFDHILDMRDKLSVKAKTPADQIFDANKEVEWSNGLKRTAAIMLIKMIGRELLNRGPIENWLESFKVIFQDYQDLPKILPQIRKMYQSTGYSINDFWQFLNKLTKTYGMNQVTALSMVSQGDIGLSLSDIFQLIQLRADNEMDLLLLAYETSLAHEIDNQQMVTRLAGGMDVILHDQVLSQVKEKDKPDPEEIKQLLEEKEEHLCLLLKKKGMNEQITNQVRDLLRQRLHLRWGQIWADWHIEKNEQNHQLSEAEVIARLVDQLNNEEQKMALLSPLLFSLEQRGYSKEVLDGFIEQVIKPQELLEPAESADKKKPLTKKVYRLPNSILNVRETEKFLQKEIARHFRYYTPFSCISLSVGYLFRGNQRGSAQVSDLAMIFHNIADHLGQILRDLDVIGTLSSVKGNHLFIILTMTEEAGCLCVVDRIKKTLSPITLTNDGGSWQVVFALTSHSFNGVETPDIKTFIRRVKSRHRKNLTKESTKII